MVKIIKYSFFVLLIINSFNTVCQGVRFQFYRTKACSTIEKLDTSYSLYKTRGSTDGNYYPKAGTVYLPGKGQYGIFADGPHIDTIFNIRDTGLFVFRFKEPDHGLLNTGAVDTPPLYSQCDSLLDGYAEYHFANGSLEMRGTFIDGFPKDSLVTFFQNGQINKRIIRKPKTVLITGYDSLGHLLSSIRRQNLSFMTYSEYSRREFYINGQVKKIESDIKRTKRIKEYYPNGSEKLILNKNFKTEYYSNGFKRISYKWTSKHDVIILDSKDFTIYKTTFDSTGQIKRKDVYKTSTSQTQPDLSIKKSDWIMHIEIYKNGKTIFLADDMDTNEFIKKYPDEVFDESDENE